MNIQSTDRENTDRNAPELAEVVTLDGKGNPHHLKVDYSTMKPIATGSRARIYKLTGSVDNGPPQTLVLKSYKKNVKGGAEKALHGYNALERDLDEKERDRLVQFMYADSANNRIFVPCLDENGTKWVVSMGRNFSVDRSELRKNKLKSIPNFDAFITRILDAMQWNGDKGRLVGPDVSFFTIKKEKDKHEMDYIYTDTETASGDGKVSFYDMTPTNLYWAGSVLSDFLDECVKNPEPYLAKVFLELKQRLADYKELTDEAKELMEKFAEEHPWPALSLKERFGIYLSRFLRFAKRHLAETWSNK